ncbi:SDR family NAD(P)-dependent oxidoreductase, partial [Streptosporangium saharense]|uniref:SDR family NAD(P)-dependent oxidoreductase n=1 Tax=Streptosporangium saharense TaxID=1706840 RepID=UPI00369009D3
PARIAADHPGVAYLPFDLMEAGPDRIAAMLADVVDLVDRGVLKPLPVTAWDIRHAPEAFRLLSRAGHVGKLVLTIPRQLDSEGTVLVTGGTGTLGALAARRLAEHHGARRLLLVSRSGPSATGIGALTADFAGLGVAVDVAACDLTDPDAVRALLATVPARHPLTAVVHAAGALADATVDRMLPGHLDRALAPKADPAWLLHSLTRDSDLAAFVMYSSAAGVLGNPGQGGYAAANAVLDALAAHRHAAGLPALAIGWGLWAETSGMTRHLTSSDHARLARSGLPSLPTATALEMLDNAMAASRPCLTALRVDRSAAPDSPGGFVPPPLAALLRGPDRAARRRTSNGGPSTQGWPERLAALPATDRTNATLSLVRETAASVLGLDDASAVTLSRPFKELGFDSLTSVELRNRLASATGLRLPASLVFDQPNAARLSAWLLERLTPTPSEGGTVEAGLAALTAALAAVEPDPETARSTAARLRELLASLDRATGTDDGVADRLDAASDAELFDFIDNELENS